MDSIYTTHAAIRSQQRGIPPLVGDWLLDYGREEFTGHGQIIRYFSNDSIRKMEGDIGKTPVRRMAEYLRCYMVQSNDGVVITVGKRHPKKHIWRH